jgi:hypothetical protein
MTKKLLSTISKVLIFSLTLVFACENSKRNEESHPIQGVWQISKITWQRTDSISVNSKPQPSLYMFTKKYYSTVWIPTDEPRQSFSKAFEPTTEELQDAFNSIVVNTGTYIITDSTLTIKPVVARMPGFAGGYARYEYEIKNDTLQLVMVDEYSKDGIQAPWVSRVRFLLKLYRVE